MTNEEYDKIARREILKAGAAGLLGGAAVVAAIGLSDSANRVRLTQEVKKIGSWYNKRRLESKAEELIDLGVNELNGNVMFRHFMIDSEGCEKDYGKPIAVALTHDEKSDYHVVLYAPKDWSNMQVSIFEKKYKHLSPPYSPGNFTLQLIPEEIKKSHIYDFKVEPKLGVYWNLMGGILDTRTNTEIELSSNIQQKIGLFYNQLKNMAHGMFDKNVDLRKCYPNPPTEFEKFMREVMSKTLGKN